MGEERLYKGNMIEKLRKSIVEGGGYKVEEVLNDLKSAMDVRDVRFRPVDWKGEAVVYVPRWVVPQDSQEVHPQLFRRVFFDPTCPSRMDCLVGLVARVAYIQEEERKKNSTLLGKLKGEIKTDEIETPRYCFNNVKDEPVFCSFIKRLEDEKTKIEKIKNAWNNFYQNISKFQKHTDFFVNVYSAETPWNEDEQKMEQWSQLKSFLEYPVIDNFLKKVNETVEYYNALYKQYESYVPNASQPACEIALPVVAAGKLLGILNLHKNEPFCEDETKLCLDYAVLLAIVYLRTQTELLENLQKVAEIMTAESSLESIASEITKGIRGSLGSLNREDVYPLLYVCKRPIGPEDRMQDFENRWKDSYQSRQKPQEDWDLELWETEEKLGPIPIRINGLGRKAIDKWRLRAQCEKTVPASRYFVVSGDVDNPDSSTGSRSALKHRIKTTGCLPLIFNRQVYGLLYIHCTKHHFFTKAELEALETFGTQAAIAINNAKLVGPPYQDLYGSALLDSLIF